MKHDYSVGRQKSQPVGTTALQEVNLHGLEFPMRAVLEKEKFALPGFQEFQSFDEIFGLDPLNDNRRGLTSTGTHSDQSSV